MEGVSWVLSCEKHTRQFTEHTAFKAVYYTLHNIMYMIIAMTIHTLSARASHYIIEDTGYVLHQEACFENLTFMPATHLQIILPVNFH